MYGPRPKPLPPALKGDDPAVEAELARQMAALCEEDAAQAAYEARAEFLPRTEEKCEREYTRMEQDVDYHYDRLHPPSHPEGV